MFVGHGLVAFAGVAGVASLLGYRRERALAVGVCAGAFALAPDVDVVYAPVGVAEAALSGADLVKGFWRSANAVHRAVTHSLLVGAATSVAVGCVAVYERGRAKVEAEAELEGERTTVDRARSALAAVVALSLCGGLIAVAGSESGPLGATVMGLFATTSLAIAIVAARRGLAAREIALAALVGLSSHPFGDLFTGAPPAFLYPLDASLVAERVVLSPDPTLHLLGAFGIELATVWLAALVCSSLFDRRLRTCVDWRAALGVAYAGAALALPAPTLDSSYQFVLSVLALGAVLGVSSVTRTDGSVRSTHWGREKRPASARRSAANARSWAIAACRRTARNDSFGTAVTGLTAVTFALLAYTVTYVYAVRAG